MHCERAVILLYDRTSSYMPRHRQSHRKTLFAKKTSCSVKQIPRTIINGCPETTFKESYLPCREDTYGGSHNCQPPLYLRQLTGAEQRLKLVCIKPTGQPYPKPPNTVMSDNKVLQKTANLKRHYNSKHHVCVMGNFTE